MKKISEEHSEHDTLEPTSKPIFYTGSSETLDTQPGHPTVLVTRTKSMDMEMQVPNIKLYQAELLKMRSSRPSLTALHEHFDTISMEEKEDNVFEDQDDRSDKYNIGAFEPPDAKIKFGWIRGVLIRCILNILGATLYLRLGWVAGHAGIGVGTLIILFSTVITTLTALSMCALCTNGEIQGGGAYFMLSRSLGPQFGGSMGVIFALADAAYSGMNVIGFAESIVLILDQSGLRIVDGGVNDTRIIATVTQLFLFIVVMTSVSWEAKTELALFAIITASYLTFIIGTFIPPSEEVQAKGVTGYKWSTFSDNFSPFWAGEDVFSVFGVYLPSVTGIMAGAGISGDLAEPNKSIPKGTLLAILLTTLLYLSGVWMTGAGCLRNASGSITDLLNGNLTACANTSSCKYGLLNNSEVMQFMGFFPPLVLAGIFATCLSSSLTCLVSSPRTFQAVCRDRLYPYVFVFGRGSGGQDHPRLATILVTIVGLLVIAVGDLNTVAPLISNLYLASFALINYACFDGSLARSPGWRPAFRYYNMWLSLLGAGLCVIAMFILSWSMALVTLAVIGVLYVYLLRRNLSVNWGSSGQAHTYTRALNDMLQLLMIEEHVKNYRPQVLVLTGNPISRPCMIDFVQSITKDMGLMVCGDVIVLKKPETLCDFMPTMTNLIYKWMHRRKIKAFYMPVVVDSYVHGVEMLMQLSGFGKLVPNIMFIGYKIDWRTCAVQEVKDYMSVVNECFKHDMALCILRHSSGFDFSEWLHKFPLIDGVDLLDPITKRDSIRLKLKSDDILRRSKDKTVGNSTAPSVDNGSPTHPAKTAADNPEDNKHIAKKLSTSLVNIAKDKTKQLVNPKRSVAAKGLTIAINQFRRKRKHATIDVWWLSDDGGLTLLVAHLLSQSKSYLEGAQLRVFAKGEDLSKLKEEEENLKALLAKFRISYAEVYVLPDLLSYPSQATVNRFNELVAPFMVKETDGVDHYDTDTYITKNQKESLERRINRHLLTHELLQKYSKEATLIVQSLPVPRKGRESAYLYLAFLEMLTQDLPPVLLVRGNQKSVLTFYS